MSEFNPTAEEKAVLNRVPPPHRLRREVQWLRDWDSRVAPEAKREYVKQEIERLQEAGEPLLYASLTAPLADQIDMALSVLREINYTPFLKLHKDAVPPPRDPQGRPLPQEEQGKVLVAKVGTRGNMAQSELKNADDSRVTKAFTGSARATMAATRQGLYNTVKITSKGAFFPLPDAISIMRAWGEGIREDRFRNPGDINNTRQPHAFQDTWLVIEVDPNEQESTPAPAHSSPKKS